MRRLASRAFFSDSGRNLTAFTYVRVGSRSRLTGIFAPAGAVLTAPFSFEPWMFWKIFWRPVGAQLDPFPLTRNGAHFSFLYSCQCYLPFTVKAKSCAPFSPFSGCASEYTQSTVGGFDDLLMFFFPDSMNFFFFCVALTPHRLIC